MKKLIRLCEQQRPTILAMFLKVIRGKFKRQEDLKVQQVLAIKKEENWRKEFKVLIELKVCQWKQECHTNLQFLVKWIT